MITFKHSGSFNNTENFLQKILNFNNRVSLDTYAQKGVDALRAATPVDSGLTSESWVYEITKTSTTTTITWSNTNVNNGVNIAIILEYGHGTGTGGYVSGRNYISPAIQPVFKEIEEYMWKEVTNS